MFKFIFKDFFLHKKYILSLGILYPLYVGWFGSRVNNPRIYALIAAFMYMIVALFPYTREDKLKAVGLSLSLPATRREIILGRFLTSWTLMTGLWILGTALALLMPGGKLGAADLVGVGAILIVLSYMTVFLCVFQPLTVQFGMTGLLIFFVAMQVLGIVAVLLRARIQTLKALIGSVGRGVAAAQEALGPAAAAAVLIVLLVVNYVSFELSAFLFKRKDY
ncbi:MAG: ABC-2 transporter permease [Candidatus Aminicenantes bacterium]|nr:ABC-2 transporter permease [Candidatus Aminicenantes bacterium]